MATEMPAALGGAMAGTETDAEQARRERIETVFVVLFGTAAVICASLLAVVLVTVLSNLGKGLSTEFSEISAVLK